MRYIDADKAKAKLIEWLDSTGALPKGTSYYHECLSCIDDTPTESAVEVIRCKDCQYWQEKNSLGTQGICLCGEKDMNYDGEFYPLANDYCSYGERRNT